MAVQEFNFTTGPATLPDVGVLSYNGCTFSPLFETKLSGKVVKDNANRTTKFMEYALSADGYVTLPAGDGDINLTMRDLRDMLTAQAGKLVYKGRGFDLVVGPQPNGVPIKGAAPTVSDVAWGPIPELIEFQPLGAGRSAKVQWKVTVRIPEIARKGDGLLQLNYETTVSYGEDGFSSLSVRGTLEVALTRGPTQKDRTLAYTVDTYRDRLERIIVGGIDLSKFRVTRREFSASRDKRTLEWDVAAEERPYMDPPPDCPVARGTYNVRPAKVGMGLVSWLCTLKATYTVRMGSPRRTAWLAFLALVRLRMNKSILGVMPEEAKPQDKGEIPIFSAAVRTIGNAVTNPLGFGAAGPFGTPIFDIMAKINRLTGEVSRRVWLMDFSVDEGLYLDSKTTTFSATWKLTTKFSHILLASGLWTKLPESATILGTKANLWAISMQNVSGAQSWLPNKLDPALDVVVDFGGP